MAQWTNLQWIKTKSERLYTTCEKSGSLHLGSYGRQAARQMKLGRFEILKLTIDRNYIDFLLCVAKVRTIFFKQFDAFLNAFFRQALLQGYFIECETLHSLTIS